MSDTMTDDKRLWILAPRETDWPAGKVMPPHVRVGQCSRCGCRVLYTPTTADLLTAGGQLTCGPCERAATPPDSIMMISSDQLPVVPVERPRPDLDAVPLADIWPPSRRRASGYVTMSVGQPWDDVLAEAYAIGWVVLELDDNERPIRAYRKITPPAT
jgi:hypothetical protein